MIDKSMFAENVKQIARYFRGQGANQDHVTMMLAPMILTHDRHVAEELLVEMMKDPKTALPTKAAVKRVLDSFLLPQGYGVKRGDFKTPGEAQMAELQTLKEAVTKLIGEEW